ncbi:MAG: hypothetical protein OXN97_02510 [Bryobacterales bacterium]|nr:hypothetical protein [Bryobacterales bacterium]
MKKIIRESHSLTLARDLGKAADRIFVDIVHELWERIDEAVVAKFKDEGLSQGIPSAFGRERIERTFGLSRKHIPSWHGLYYPLGGTDDNQDAPSLGIEINSGCDFFIGIRCRREGSEGLTAVKGAYAAIQKAVSDSPSADFERDNDPWWPCWRYVLRDSRSFTFENAVKLETVEAQKEIAKEIAEELRKLWTTLKDHSDTQHLF